MGDMKQAFILLLAGFIVVFVVLILLIVIVSLYSKLITSVQSGREIKKEKKRAVQSAENAEAQTTVAAFSEDNDGEIPNEVIAVIAAAVEAFYGDKPHRIKSVTRSARQRSAWARAGALDNTRPF